MFFGSRGCKAYIEPFLTNQLPLQASPCIWHLTCKLYSRLPIFVCNQLISPTPLILMCIAFCSSAVKTLTDTFVMHSSNQLFFVSFALSISFQPRKKVFSSAMITFCWRMSCLLFSCSSCPTLMQCTRQSTAVSHCKLTTTIQGWTDPSAPGNEPGALPIGRRWLYSFGYMLKSTGLLDVGYFRGAWRCTKTRLTNK